MEKLINSQVIEAKNVICVWREDGDDEHMEFRSGIALDTAMLSYMIPRYIVIGTYDNGSVMAGGMYSMNFINEYGEDTDCTSANGGWPDLFMYHQFCSWIDIYVAKALVRELIDEGESESSAKAQVLSDMESIGVRMSDEAKEYLSNREE